METLDRKKSKHQWIATVALVVLVLGFGGLSVWQDQGLAFVGVLTVGVTGWEVLRRSAEERARLQDDERREQQARREEARRESKIALYTETEIIDFWFTALMGSDTQKQKAMKNADQTFRDQTKGLIPWASDGVISAMSAIRTAERDRRHPLEPFTEPLLALRADLGHSNAKIDGYTLLTLFVTDLDRQAWASLCRPGTSNLLADSRYVWR